MCGAAARKSESYTEEAVSRDYGTFIAGSWRSLDRIEAIA
jgi:hypothetical protein